MEEKKEAKTPAKPKAKSGPKEPKLEMMDWKQAAAEIEAALKEKGWTSAKQRRNPAFLDGLVKRHIVRPLIDYIHKNMV